MTDTIVTSTIKGAVFADGSTLSGTWTADYNSAGILVSVSNATFTVSGSGGTTVFTSMGTLPYAVDPNTSTSFEIHNLSSSGGSYTALYIDWKTENPSSLYEGTPSLYTSVKNAASSTPATAIRLASDGTTGHGSLPAISGLPAAQNAGDLFSMSPFLGVSVIDPDVHSSTSATIVLSNAGVPTDADGLLSGIGLTWTSAGTYTLAATSPLLLTAELDLLRFKPTYGQVSPGNTVTTKFDLAINDSDGSASASSVLTVLATCFLPGTMIATPTGEAAVESLVAGDLVVVLEDGIRVPRALTWVGSGQMDASRFANRTEAYPVRIRQDAFSAGVPLRDLLVTPEHCILTESGLTPVRMLVNGSSILVDRTMPTYAFFHVELATHGILLAEGLATESYLNTGNRDLFADAAAGIALPEGAPLAAPLAVERALVEPVWRRLADRARSLGLTDGQPVVTMTDQAELRLLLDTGAELSACSHDRQRRMFRIPQDTRAVRLLSRTTVPSELIGPFLDDRRTLGVAIEKLVLWEGLDETVIHASGLGLPGWHDLEGNVRWTDGNALLDLPIAGAETYLDVYFTPASLYPAETAIAA